MRGAFVIASMLSVLSASTAQAAATLCVEVRADSEAPAMQQLVLDELGHHPTHRIVTADCQSHLVVEIFTLGGVRYLTARIDREIPVRHALRSPREIDDKLGEALRQVLAHDPVYLAEDVARLNRVWRAGTSLLKRGTNRYRVELFEVLGTSGKNPVFASGGAISFSRSSEHLLVFARVAVAGAPSTKRTDEIALRVVAGGEAGLMWESSARGSTTFYLGPGVGLHYLRFEGSGDVSPTNAILLSIGLRAGVRFLRFHDFDLDLYAEAHLPLYKTVDPDSTLVDAYTPFGTLGLGVGF